MPETLAPDVDVPATERLYQIYRPKHYTLNLNVDPAKDDFTGRVVIELELARPSHRIVLHASAIQVSAAAIGGHSVASADIRSNPAEETLTLEAGRELPAGPVRVELAYSAPFNLQMSGLYIQRATHKGKPERHAFTKFEPTDARKMLPCVDEPEAKATFDVTVAAPDQWTVLGNTSVLRRETKHGKQTVMFKTSPKMSTYLLAIGVGRLASKTAKVGRTKIGVWALPEQIGQASFALDCAKFTLAWLNRYFSIPYPLEKLDLVALTEFSSGAMENWGLITFRDSAMLVDPKLSSGRAYRRVAEVVAHEIVHQWFGNLVTMRWWNDLWLNEAFATWLAYKVVDAWKPKWRMWRSYEERKSAALPVDSLENTRPISSEVRSVGDIEAQFDLLTYEKGGAVLRMIETYLGEKAFRDGVRIYMRRHQYGNTEARDLWRAIEEASDEPIARLADDWLTRPGFPMIEVHAGDDSMLTVSQRRFSAYGGSDDEKLWTSPVIMKFKRAGEKKIRTQRLMLREREATVKLEGKGEIEWLYPNAGESGFYRILLGPELRRKLSAASNKALSPEERSGWLGNVWALARNGSLTVGDFVEALRGMSGETDWIVLDVGRACLAALHDRVASADAERSALRNLGLAFAGPAAKKLGWGPQKDEDKKTARASAIGALAALSPDGAFVRQASALLDRYLKKPVSVDPSLATIVLDLGARLDPSRFQQYVRCLGETKTPEQKDYFLKALAEFREPNIVREALQLGLTEKILGQDLWKPLGLALRNPPAQKIAWEFLREHWPAIRRKAGDRGAARAIEYMAGYWSLHAKQESEAFFQQPAHRIPSADRALKQTLELMQLGAEFAQRAKNELRELAL